MSFARTLPVVAALVVSVALAGCGNKPRKQTRVKPAPRPPATQSADRPQTRPAPESRTASPTPTTPAQPQDRTVATAPPAARAPQVNTNTPGGRYAHALELLKSRQWREAEIALIASMKEFPDRSGPHANLGILYALTDRKQTAQKAFSRAVSLNPRNAIAHNWLGVLAREAGDYRNAEFAYRRAINADSKYAPAYLNLAILYDRYVNRPSDALEAYRRYRDLAGSDDPRAAVWVAELESRTAAQGAQQ